LRGEALEGRTLLASVAPLPFSVALLGNASLGPPDPCIQFNPQPLVSAAATNAAIQWKGQFSEKLQESSPSTAVSTAAPAAWLVDVIYNLNQQPSPLPVPMFIVKGSYNFYVSGTAKETLTPLNASGSPLASAQAWVSNDSIQSQVTVLPTIQASPVANTYTFSTDTTIQQTLTLLAAAAAAPTTAQSWIANTTTLATGTITEAPSLTSGTLSLNEQIHQTLSPLSAKVVGPAWTISAQFAGGGTFQEALPATAAALPSGTLALTGVLTGTVSPPKGSLLPTQSLNSRITVCVLFSPTS
jgi:hypothetical protein